MMELELFYLCREMVHFDQTIFFKWLETNYLEDHPT